MTFNLLTAKCPIFQLACQLQHAVWCIHSPTLSAIHVYIAILWLLHAHTTTTQTHVHFCTDTPQPLAAAPRLTSSPLSCARGGEPQPDWSFGSVGLSANSAACSKAAGGPLYTAQEKWQCVGTESNYCPGKKCWRNIKGTHWPQTHTTLQ